MIWKNPMHALHTPTQRELEKLLDYAHYEGFSSYVNQTKHRATFKEDRAKAQAMMAELRERMYRDGPPLYHEEYAAAVYLLLYHTGRCVAAQFAYRELFKRIGTPTSLLVHDVGAGTGAGRAGLALAIVEGLNFCEVRYTAQEPSEAMLKAGRDFYHELLMGMPIETREKLKRPTWLYEETDQPAQSDWNLAGDPTRIVTAFHLSVPYDQNKLPEVQQAAEASMKAALQHIKPHVGVFTAPAGKEEQLRTIIDQYPGWQQPVPDDIPLPTVKERKEQPTHAYWRAAEEGFVPPKDGENPSLEERSRRRFQPGPGTLFMRFAERKE